MKAEHIEVMKRMGLKGTEAKAYLTLLETGKSLAGAVADRAKLHRRNTYDALEHLLQKGLVSYTISNNKKYWTAIHPEKIQSIIKENEALVASMLPELTLKFNSIKLKQTVEVLEGLGGMKTFYNDTLKEKHEITILFSTGNAYKRLPIFMRNYYRQINKAKVKVNILLNPGIDKDLYIYYKYCEVKILPNYFSTLTQLFIYGNKSAIVFWSENPICILITSEEITSGFRKYFEHFWKMGKKVKVKYYEK